MVLFQIGVALARIGAALFEVGVAQVWVDDRPVQYPCQADLLSPQCQIHTTSASSFCGSFRTKKGDKFWKDYMFVLNMLLSLLTAIESDNLVLLAHSSLDGVNRLLFWNAAYYLFWSHAPIFHLDSRESPAGAWHDPHSKTKHEMHNVSARREWSAPAERDGWGHGCRTWWCHHAILRVHQWYHLHIIINYPAGGRGISGADVSRQNLLEAVQWPKMPAVEIFEASVSLINKLIVFPSIRRKTLWGWCPPNPPMFWKQVRK